MHPSAHRRGFIIDLSLVSCQLTHANVLIFHSPLEGCRQVRRHPIQTQPFRRALAGSVFAVSIASAAFAFGDESPVHIDGDAVGCPSPEAVASALNDAFTRHRADVLHSLPSADGGAESVGDTVRLEDRGGSYRVSVHDETREFSDPARQCENRARAASVFVALLLEPPDLFVAEPPAPPAPKPSPPPTPVLDAAHVHRRPRGRIELQLGGLLEGTPNSGGHWAGGAEARLSLGIRTVSFIVGLTGTSPITLDLPGTRARLTRIPIDVGVRGTLPLGQLELALDLGFVAGVALIEDLDLGTRSGGTRFDPGVRASLMFAAWVKNRIAPFIAFQTLVSFQSIPLSVETVGTVGSTPTVWLGAILGVKIRLH